MEKYVEKGHQYNKLCGILLENISLIAQTLLVKIFVNVIHTSDLFKNTFIFEIKIEAENLPQDKKKHTKSVLICKIGTTK